MSFLSGLASLLGTVGHDINQVNPFHAQTAQAPGRTPIEAPPPGWQQMQHRQLMQPIPRQLAQPKAFINPGTGRPDFTYNPNPNTNIPYSTHNYAAFHTAGLSSLAQLLGNINTATGMTGPGMLHGEQDIPMQGQSYYQTPFR